MSKKGENERIKGWKNRLKFIFERLDKGLRPADFRREEEEEEEIPHATLNELLEFLHKSGIAYLDEKDGRWYYTWKKEKEELMRQYEEYANVNEFEYIRDHSEKVIEMLEDRLSLYNRPFRLGGVRKGDKLAIKYSYILSVIQDSACFDIFLQHLDSGYPDVFQLYRDWEKLGDECKMMNDTFIKEIAKIISEKDFEIKEKLSDLGRGERQVTSTIFESIKRYCKLADETMIKKGVMLRLTEEGIFDPIVDECIAKNESLKEELEKLIEFLIHDEAVRNLYNNLAAIEDLEEELYSTINQKIGRIFRSVKLRSPLKGSCEACRYHIGRSP